MLQKGFLRALINPLAWPWLQCGEADGGGDVLTVAEAGRAET